MWKKTLSFAHLDQVSPLPLQCSILFVLKHSSDIQTPTEDGAYPYYNHPDLIEGFNGYIWGELRLGRALPEYYRRSVYTHHMGEYMAAVREFSLALVAFTQILL